jgi:hypothetical protein
MTGMSKIESYLIDLDISYQEIESNTFLLDDESKGLTSITINLAEPIVVIRVIVMKLPENNRADLFEQLLRLNGTEVVHGAYGIDGNNIVIIDTLEYDTMDRHDFEASLDSISLALSRDYAILNKFRK